MFLLSAQAFSQVEADTGTPPRAEQIPKYKAAIKHKVMRYIVLPSNLQGNPEVEFEVVLLPYGFVLGAQLKRSSGNEKYDNAVARAIEKAQPLPVPPDPKLFSEAFRQFNLTFRPQE